ncbi:MAG: TROVE domain-containing protein, partial [Candidatus Omnitrophica bacterium]|nr:TROVE domain-containing protein [Candidatus Omnitrophota bacterium]
MKFRKTSKDTKAVRNYMGAKSFEQSPKEELTFAVISTFLEDSYYESKDSRIKRIEDLVEKVSKTDPEFVATLAIVTRKEFYMRSAFHLLIGALAKFHKKDSLVSKTIVQGVERVDDLAEIVAYSGKPIPNQIKKGIARKLVDFGPYQLAKYKGIGKDISLVDLFNLVHPKPPEDKKEIWSKLLKGKLEAPDTWEVGLSSGKDKGKVWKDLVMSGKIGYMALLRNLRNILKQADKETIDEAVRQISDRERVKKSKQLPFRFLSAYSALEESKTGGLTFEKEKGNYEPVKDAVRKALEYSVNNIPLLEGRTLILSDNSGSMYGDRGGASPVSAMSQRKTADIANLFALLYWLKADNTLVGLFGDKLITPKLDRTKNIFENFKIVNEEAEECGESTEEGIFDIFKDLIKEKKMVDRIVIFSDGQVGDGCEWYDRHSNQGGDFNKLFQKYKAINPNVIV